MVANHPHSDIFSAEQLKKNYNDMLTVRRFEERCAKAYSEKLIAGFCHLYIGQEAVAVGVKEGLKEGDSMITAYRDHGHHIVSGESLEAIMSELFGKATGSSKGKGGSMHLFNPKGHFYGGHGIVGAQVPLGTGLAFASKYKGTDNLCAVFFGDGALNQGQVYESFNMAKLWNLPVLYIIENNYYAMGTSIERGCANSERLFERGIGFGIPGEAIDGMDIFAVKRTVLNAAAYVRQNGPAILEMQTYRYRGHSMSDPAKYRTREEVDEYRNEHDPLLILSKYMEEYSIVDKSWFDEVEAKVKAAVDKAYDAALHAPQPSEDVLYQDVYSNN